MIRKKYHILQLVSCHAFCVKAHAELCSTDFRGVSGITSVAAPTQMESTTVRQKVEEAAALTGRTSSGTRGRES